MGTTPLRQFLQSLCCNSSWNYAVFWKLQHQNQMLLTWEDGYCDILKQRESMESILDNICFKGSDEIFSTKCQSSMCDGNLGGYPIELAVAYMSSVQYALGDGVVGEVAYTGNCLWVYSENMSAGEFNSKLVPECPDEWLLQFAAGIKTLLLVPVIPHGVLQFGSLETVAEDLALVSYIKDSFIAHKNFVGYSVSSTENREYPFESSASLLSTLMENLDESSALTMNDMDTDVKPTIHKLSTPHQITPRCVAQNSSNIFGKDKLQIFNSAIENDTSIQLTGLIEVPEPLYQSLNCNKLEMMENSMFRVSCLEEELHALSNSNNYNIGLFGEYANRTMNSYSDQGMTKPPSVDKDADNEDHESVSTFFSFPRECELHKALGPSLMGQTNGYLWDSSVSGEDACSSSSLFRKGTLIHGTESSALETSGLLANEDDAEQFLEAVFADVYCGSDENSPNRINSVKSSMISSGQFAASSKGQSQSERSAVVGKDVVPRSSGTSAFFARDQIVRANSSPSASSFESVITLIEEQQKKGHSYPHPSKGSKLSSTGKRRARPGDNQRPRPRDRQLIQDRVKELRELVPNGAKCSIDGLLDRTIKHMLFLRSVTGQADKLRQWVHEEVAGRKNLRSHETKAFELGSEQLICPIVVEDLKDPGHMLIEMLCNDHGRFLEITEVIHRLELTILKGVIERRSDDRWAHFIIEAPRGFHRLDIFWPLMQLLQQSRSPISSKI